MNTKYVLDIFMDITKSFDNVWWPSVLSFLKKMHCPRTLCPLIKDYLNGRKVLIREGYKTTEKHVNRDCPQGSVLGRVLWNLIFNLNLERLESMCIEFIVYADDQVILIGADSRKKLSVKGQLGLNEISEWCILNKLELALSKCALMMVKGNLHKKCSSDIRINGQRIKRTVTFKYRGINFGTGMSVGTHFEAIANRTRELFNGLGRLAKNEWDIKYKAFNAIYRSLQENICPSTHSVDGESLSKPGMREKKLPI